MHPTEVRRARIADAVITVLAERGSRGLTHRAVDEVAGLPVGSTSYYHRSRAELLQAAVPRLAELDAEVVLPEGDGTSLLEALSHVLEVSLRGAGYTRTLARYELVLEASRRPGLQEELTSGTERLLSLLVDHLGVLRTEDAATRARDLLAFLDGLILAEVTSPVGRRRSTAELTAAIARFLEALTARR